MTNEEIASGGMPHVKWRESWIGFMSALSHCESLEFFWAITNYSQWGEEPNFCNIYSERFFKLRVKGILDNDREKWFSWYENNKIDLEK